jgi:hypothetical protein
MPARVLGGVTMVAVFALDQASKFAILHGFGAPGQPPRFLTPFLDLTLNWNRGISFSLLPQDTLAGIWLLLGFTVVATALLGVWLWFARTPLVGLGLGAIIGGALGNACDRRRRRDQCRSRPIDIRRPVRTQRPGPIRPARRPIGRRLAVISAQAGIRWERSTVTANADPACHSRESGNLGATAAIVANSGFPLTRE